MKNFVQEGDVITLTAPSGGYTGGQLVVVGSLVGVATSTVAEGGLCAVSVEGVYTIPKAAPALTVGTKVYSNAGAAVTTTNTDTYVGIVVKAAALNSTEVEVLLNY